MLRQSKPLPRPSGPSSPPDLSFLSLDWDGCAHRYPGPQGAGIRRRGSPLAEGFLMAQRDPIVRPTHHSPSSDTLGSRGSRGSGGTSSGPSSPNRSPGEGMGSWETPSPASEPRRGQLEILNDYQHPRPMYEAQSQREEPLSGCTDGHHTSSGLGGSIRKKLGRRVACSRCGETYEVKQLARKPSLLERPLRHTQKQGSYV